MSTAKNRVVAVILGLVMAFAATACGQDDDPPSNDVGSFDRGSTLAR
ncbi:MAG TPA: hypothetical protein VK960_10110 [Acidimicrobiia bacterium]|nr:hypothetical protein [Acidimicrobiia bacterium]